MKVNIKQSSKRERNAKNSNAETKAAIKAYLESLAKSGKTSGQAATMASKKFPMWIITCKFHKSLLVAFSVCAKPTQTDFPFEHEAMACKPFSGYYNRVRTFIEIGPVGEDAESFPTFQDWLNGCVSISSNIPAEYLPTIEAQRKQHERKRDQWEKRQLVKELLAKVPMSSKVGAKQDVSPVAEIKPTGKKPTNEKQVQLMESYQSGLLTAKEFNAQFKQAANA